MPENAATPRTRFLVERYWPGVTLARLTEGIRQIESAAIMSGGTRAIRHLGSAVIVTEETVFCLFEGVSADVVRKANERAGLPFDRIVEVLLLSAERGRTRLNSTGDDDG